MLDEQPIAQAALLQLIVPALAAVAVFAGIGGLNQQFPVLASLDTGIVERIDVDGHSQRVLRQFFRTGNGAEVEATCVVGLHRPLVVGIVVVD